MATAKTNGSRRGGCRGSRDRRKAASRDHSRERRAKAKKAKARSRQRSSRDRERRKHIKNDRSHKGGRERSRCGGGTKRGGSRGKRLGSRSRSRRSHTRGGPLKGGRGCNSGSRGGGSNVSSGSEDSSARRAAKRGEAARSALTLCKLKQTAARQGSSISEPLSEALASGAASTGDSPAASGASSGDGSAKGGDSEACGSGLRTPAEEEEFSACTCQTPATSDAPDGQQSEENETSGSYYTEYSVEAPKVERKEDITHVEWKDGMMLKSRYKVSKCLGDGTFGRVLMAEDTKKGRQVAVKVIREVDKYVRNAKREAEILRDIREADDPRSASCVIMYDTFMHDHRIFCLAFEVLGASLYDILKQNRFRGFWVQDIQTIARDCLEALTFLHDGLNLTHTDLKLENVLFQSTELPVAATFPREAAFLERHKSQVGKPCAYVRPKSAKIKLIDFGNATYELEHHSSIINTRQYRAPEVILATGWNERSDLWSIGCIVMELYTGELLFRTHNSLEHLALMERVIQPFPQSMLAKASDARRDSCLLKEDEEGPWRLRWPPDGVLAESEQKVATQQPLAKLVQRPHRRLAEFVTAILQPEPSGRLSAASASKHAFFSEAYED